MTNTDWTEIGRIVAPQGLKGEVRVYPSSDFPERFLTPGRRWLRYPNQPQAQPPEPIELIQGRLIAGRGLYVVRLEGIGDRHQAETLRGCTLLVPASDRPPLEADEFYVDDLIGLRVMLQTTGEKIGEVTDVYSAGNDLLEVTLQPPGDPPRRVLIPFVPAIVPEVNLPQGYLEITPPSGLLD
jgi:16S rRNA processing protein RimM